MSNSYIAPMRDIHFLLNKVAGLEEVLGHPACKEIDSEMVEAILEHAGKFAELELSVLNKSGDEEGAKWHKDAVVMPAGFKAAYKSFVESGWGSVSHEQEHGGQGFPSIVSVVLREFWSSANMSFALLPALNDGSAEVLSLFGSDYIKSTFLDNLVSGVWTGTMNLTEPQAGSDLSRVRCRAEPADDGTYKLFGQKIFITYGEHDLADNILHLVLARLPGAPEGIKGISLFLVPKYLVNEDGSLGDRNDIHCVSIEHKLGIHASPTCIMAHGENGGAVGYLIGEPNRGMEYMFVMMNDARLQTAVQGMAVAERSYQQALAYAKERVQGRSIHDKHESIAIIGHPDVRRMLMWMKVQVESMRAMIYFSAATLDHSKLHADPAVRKENLALAELILPVIKGCCTEIGFDVASHGVQIHGGAGYIEETGAAQHLRDIRIASIYEGTTTIQANDLVGRKILSDNGLAIKSLIQKIRQTEFSTRELEQADITVVHRYLSEAVAVLDQSVDYILKTYQDDPSEVLAMAVPFLRMVGAVLGCWVMAIAAKAAMKEIAQNTNSEEFYLAKCVTASFYAVNILVPSVALVRASLSNRSVVFRLADESF